MWSLLLKSHVQIFVFLGLYFNLISSSSSQTDTLLRNQVLRDGDTLTSANNVYQLQFFSRPYSTLNRYVGIWNLNSKYARPVWIANKESPITETSGVLTFAEDGNLVLSGQQGRMWSTNASISSKTTVAVLLDSGNLVLREGNSSSGRILWQSFDHPCDILIPGMKIGVNSRTRESRVLRSWKSDEDPAPGSFTFGFDESSFSSVELFVWRGSSRYWRSIFWNGTAFTVAPRFRENLINFTIFGNKEEIYFTYTSNSNLYSMLQLTPSGVLTYVTDFNKSGVSFIDWSGRADRCSISGACGVFSSCNDNNHPPCKCLPGFEPLSPTDWDSGFWADGCVRKSRLQCGGKDGFLLLNGVTTRQEATYYTIVGDEQECRLACQRVCRCNAYAYNSGCKTWESELTDIVETEEDNIDDAGVQQLHIRLSASSLRITGRQCPNCGTNIIPYPLGIGKKCGHPAYNTLKCDPATSQLRFLAPEGRSYLVTSINSKKQRFIIELKDSSTCWKSGSQSSNFYLNSSQPFYITTNNTLFLLNCSKDHSASSSAFDCSSSSGCRSYIEDGQAPCASNSQGCCTYRPGATSSSKFSFSLRGTWCGAYSSVVDINTPPGWSEWREGLEIGWKTA